MRWPWEKKRTHKDATRELERRLVTKIIDTDRKRYELDQLVDRLSRDALRDLGENNK